MKYVKKLLYGILFSFLLIVETTNPVAAEVTAAEENVIQTDAEVSDGAVEVSVSVSHLNATSGRIVVYYDTDVLTLQDTKAAGLYALEDVNSSYREEGKSGVAYAWAVSGTDEENGTVLTASFKINESTDAQKTVIETVVKECYQENQVLDVAGTVLETEVVLPEKPEEPGTSEEPENTEKPEDSENVSDSKDENNTSGVTGTVSSVDQNKNAVEEVTQSADGKSVRTLKSKGNQMIIISGEGTVLPAGSDFVLKQVSTESADYQKAAAAVESQLPNCQNFAVYDINLMDSSNVQIHQLGGYVSVTMPVPAGISTASGNRLGVYRLEADGTLTRCEAVVKDGMVTFYTDHFSTYIFVEEAAGIAPDTSDAGTVTIFVTLLLLVAGACCIRYSKKRV